MVAFSRMKSDHRSCEVKHYCSPIQEKLFVMSVNKLCSSFLYPVTFYGLQILGNSERDHITPAWREAWLISSEVSHNLKLGSGY